MRRQLLKHLPNSLACAPNAADITSLRLTLSSGLRLAGPKYIQIFLKLFSRTKRCLAFRKTLVVQTIELGIRFLSNAVKLTGVSS